MGLVTGLKELNIFSFVFGRMKHTYTEWSWLMGGIPTNLDVESMN